MSTSEKKEKNEFFALLCNLYIIALLVALPLYTGGGYGQLGDKKYLLFRNISFFCLGIWLIAGMPGRLRAAVDWVRAFGTRKKRPGEGHGRFPFNWLDCAAAAYGACVLVSAVCSSYGKLAWAGYNEWYMGAVSQLLFVGIYFFVSRQYDGALWPLYLGEAALFIVTLLGLWHRLGIDPLGLMTGWTKKNWEYTHMLSTLGNINWLCGYYSVALSFLIVHFLREERRWLQVFLYIASVLSYVLLVVQGSQGGWLILIVCTGGCVLLGRKRMEILKKTALLLTGFFLCMPLMELLLWLRGDRAAMPADGNIYAYVPWFVWLIAGGVCLLPAFLADKAGRSAAEKLYKEKRAAAKGRAEAEASAAENGETERKAAVKKRQGLKRTLTFGSILIGLLIAFFIFCRSVDDSFGSGRGFLWHISLEWLSEAGVKEKLIGAGPDCYGAAVFQSLGTGSDVWKGERWEYSVFTNAHNEFLNQLCNMGILGAAGYGAIFLAGLCLCWKCCRGGRRGEKEESRGSFYGWLGFLALAMYGAHSLVSFQQVLNAPFLFLVLGLFGSSLREITWTCDVTEG